VYAGIALWPSAGRPGRGDPPGPDAALEAEKARTRLLSQVDERRNPRGPGRRWASRSTDGSKCSTSSRISSHRH